MALTNAERQKRWRDKRNALAKLGLKYQAAAAAKRKAKRAAKRPTKQD
jgi:hypothetical protein